MWQAAVYGRAFVPADALPKDAIVSAARKLRILNTLREPEARSALANFKLESRTQMLPIDHAFGSLHEHIASHGAGSILLANCAMSLP